MRWVPSPGQHDSTAAGTGRGLAAAVGAGIHTTPGTAVLHSLVLVSCDRLLSTSMLCSAGAAGGSACVFGGLGWCCSDIIPVMVLQQICISDTGLLVVVVLLSLL
jgi:hypothetical protein